MLGLGFSSSDIEKAVRAWLILFNKFPRATVIGTIVLALGLFGGVGYLVVSTRQRNMQETQRRADNLSYTQQLDSLNNVQGSLNNLIAFVEMQKTKLKESEDLISNLRSEQEKLKPVVEADRKTVDALLELQAQRAEQNISRERWYGFGLGVLSSIVASSLIGLLSYLAKRKRNRSATAESPIR